MSTGISEGILNALAGVEGLHVTARLSSFAFLGQALSPEANIPRMVP